MSWCRLLVFMSLIFLAFYLRAQDSLYLSYYQKTKAAKYVNPLIGTAGYGYTFPHACSPWGMVSAGPHTTYSKPIDFILKNPIAPGGYYYAASYITGFGQTHLSGVACPALGVPVIAVNFMRLNPWDYSSRYTDQIARAGFYAVTLTGEHTRFYITSTERTAIYKIKFLSAGTFYLLIDNGKGLTWGKTDGYVRIINDRACAGWVRSKNFCRRENSHKVYFYVKIRGHSVSNGLWQRHKIITDKQQVSGKAGAWFAFTGQQSIDVMIGISYVSIQNAKENLERETRGKSFEQLLKQNMNLWDKYLSRIMVLDTGRQTDKQVFYTALYHSLLHPNIISDINGQYPDYQSNSVRQTSDYPRYGLFSMWDTYRTLHPFLTLFYPEQEQGMLYTLEDMTLRSGHSPKWEYHGQEINLMVGDPGSAILSEGFIKGFRLHHPDSLFWTLYRNATGPSSKWRPGNTQYLSHGYIPLGTKHVWGPVSTTLEYAYADWALSRFAYKLGYFKQAKILETNSHGWRKLFDKQTETIRPRTKKGKWLRHFSPITTRDYSTIIAILYENGGPGFVEENAYQYTFMVPHDVQGLISLLGSEQKLTSRLRQLFENKRFNISNEPDFLYPYLFFVDKSQAQYMQSIIRGLRKAYFTDSSDGLPGNDDAGAMSAWLVFSDIGIYPLCPACANYTIGIPMFKHIVLHFPKTHKRLDIRAIFSTRAGYWQKVYFNGNPLDTLVIKHDNLNSGGTITFR